METAHIILSLYDNHQIKIDIHGEEVDIIFTLVMAMKRYPVLESLLHKAVSALLIDRSKEKN